MASQNEIRAQLGTKIEKYCISCGKRGDGLSLCGHCVGAWYCSKECQQADWPVHKILCAKYAELSEQEPEKQGYRALLFRHDSRHPQLIILPREPYRPRRLELLISETIETCGFGYNERIGITHISKGGLRVLSGSYHVIDNSPRNKSIFASVKTTGFTPPHAWAGNVVVRRGTGGVTMADLRHAIDWFGLYPEDLMYMHSGPRTPPVMLERRLWPVDLCWPRIKGVRIKCNQHIKDESERYTAVLVPGAHPIRGLTGDVQGDISPISKQVGLPLRLLISPSEGPEFSPNTRPDHTSLRETRLLVQPGPGRASCVPVVNLMRSLNQKKLNAFGFCPWQWEYTAGALVVRADDTDLTVDEVKAMVHFVGKKCLGRFERELEIEAKHDATRQLHDFVLPVAAPVHADVSRSMKEAMGFITYDNYLQSFDDLGLARPPAVAPGSEILDLRGPIVEDMCSSEGKDDSAEEDEDEFAYEDEEDYDEESGSEGLDLADEDEDQAIHSGDEDEDRASQV